MISEAVKEALQGFVPEDNIHLQEPMRKHTTFRLGGPADCLLEIDNVEQLQKLLRYMKLVEMPFFVLGNGSNLLVGDQGYEGIILHMGSRMNAVRVEGTRVIAQAGASLAQMSRAACEHGLTGMEFAAGIPGTVGGAVVMNAGAYGGEMRQIVVGVTVLDKEGNLLELDNDTMEFGYRTSAIKNHPFLVTEVTVELEQGSREAINARMEELAAKRREKQPLEYPSAGSTFKRPEGYYAGELIMKAGLRGFQIGGARVSDKHCGFVINTGNACAADVLDVIQEVRSAVKDRFNVDLEPEVVMLGEF